MVKKMKKKKKANRINHLAKARIWTRELYHQRWVLYPLDHGTPTYVLLATATKGPTYIKLKDNVGCFQEDWFCPKRSPLEWPNWNSRESNCWSSLGRHSKARQSNCIFWNELSRFLWVCVSQWERESCQVLMSRYREQTCYLALTIKETEGLPAYVPGQTRSSSPVSLNF